MIDRFFNTLDSTDADAGDRLADEIFTQDGKLKLGGKWLVGSDAIRRSRDNVWNAITSRRHVIVKVYSSQADTCDDLLLLGNNTIQVRSGKTVQFNFVARIGLEGLNSSDLRIKSCETWADSAPVKEALQS
ncbi:hypothetical protein NW754_001350 [Fusarium falciforme]|nr:hypothetical protein NW754_001350 [Fusarium falciforme]KAJ4229775.1 hypothetical protein NW757_014019 [Fusarium falciforme]